MDDEVILALIGDAPDVFETAMPEATRWTAEDRRAPGEAARRADFAFVFPAGPASVSDLVENRGMALMMAGGSCVVACDLPDRGSAQRMSVILDEAGLDCLDLVYFADGNRIAVGGERDTFDMLRPVLKRVGATFYVGPAGSSLVARDAEGEALACGPDEAALAAVFGRVEVLGAFAAPIRNLLKAGPAGGPEFDAIADALTRRR